MYSVDKGSPTRAHALPRGPTTITLCVRMIRTQAKKNQGEKKPAEAGWRGEKIYSAISLNPSNDSIARSTIDAENSDNPNMRACAMALDIVLSNSSRVVLETLPALAVDGVAFLENGRILVSSFFSDGVNSTP